MNISGKSIGIRMKQIRGTDSQEVAAKKTGISISALKNYERDIRVPTLEAIDKIAKAYGIAPCLVAYGSKNNDENTNIVNKIMMLEEDEKKAIKIMINALEVQSIIKNQDKFI